MFWVKQGFQEFLRAINRFLTLKNMGADTKISFLSTLEAELLAKNVISPIFVAAILKMTSHR